MKLQTLPLLAVVVALVALLGPSLVSAFFPLDIAGGLAKGAIGKIRAIKHGIGQHIRRRMCERLRQGRIYMEPCEQFNQNQGGGGGGGGGGNGYPAKPNEEVIIEEYERPNQRPRGRPHKPVLKEEVIIEEYQPTGGGGGGGGGYGRPPKKNQPVVVEETETTYVPQPSNNRPVYGGGGGGGGYGRPPRPRPPPPQPKPREEVVEEGGGGYQVKPETVVKEMEDEGDNFHEKVPEDERKPPPPPPRKPNLPGGRPHQPKQGRQQQQQKPQGKATPGEPCQTTEGLRGLCMPSAYCYSQYATLEDYRANRCELGGAGGGICCSQEEPEVDIEDLPIRIPQRQRQTSNVRFISLEDINSGAKEAQTFIQREIDKERALVRRGMVQQHGSMQSMHQSFFGDFDPVQFRLTKGGFISLVTTVIIMNKFKLSKEDARDGLTRYSIENTDLEQFCIKEPACTPSKYRSLDGSCTNLQRPLWGKANTAFERLLPPEYDDGLHEPRKKSVLDGSLLPSARLVSLHLARQQNAPEPRYTLMVMQWGQFIDHDLTLASSTRTATGQGVMCCDERQQPIDHHACFPILIAEDDRFYGRHRQRCMHFVRNSPAPRSGCSLGHREQMNTLTHTIDASMVYGNSLERSKELRTFRDGRLKSSQVNQAQWLPLERKNASEDCSISEAEQRRFKCFVAGDVRVNEQLGLTMMHNLLLREHNRIAAKLKELNNNRRWNDEVLFQETRRIVAAIIQHITYSEWLPLVLSRKVMKAFNILPKSFGYSKSYNPRVNPNILNSFATAAYRMHSLIQGTLAMMDENGNVQQRIRLHDIFFAPKDMYRPNAFDLFLNGFTTEPAQSFDRFFTEELTNHLFQAPGTGFGMDLVALNIQRGRDHGLPGYNAFRRLCGQPPLRSFRDLDEAMGEGEGQAFAAVYKHVDDIDLFIGGAHERPLPEALVGPTFACIIAEQKRRGKVGDRFWYENGGQPTSFRPNQLAEIRKVSLASLICENADTISKVQPLAFLRPGGFNAKLPCEQIPRMNLAVFKNEKLWDE